MTILTAFFATKKPANLNKEPNFPIADQAYSLFKEIQLGTIFAPTNQAHTDLLTKCTLTFNNKFDELKAADYRMAIGFAVGITAFALSFVFPVAIFMTAGLVYGAYYLAIRQQLFTEYTQSLENMMNAVKWSAGDVKGHAREVLNSAHVLNLTTALVDVATKQQLFDVIDNNIEERLFGSAQHEAVTKGTKFAGVELDQDHKKLYYTVYGFEQGNLFDILPGIGHAIVNGFNAAKLAIFGPSTDNHEKLDGGIKLN